MIKGRYYMTNLDQEQKSNRILYRELFFKANEDFKKQINKLKIKRYCKSSGVCCKIRYTNLAPSEIYELSNKESISAEYLKLFVPYGAGQDFNYETNSFIDKELNHSLAMKSNADYVNLIISKHPEPVYFYYCKNLDLNSNCSAREKSVLCSSFPDSVTTILPKECGFRDWQKDSLQKIREEISRDILLKVKEIKEFRYSFDCKKTGCCCRLAGSEFSYEELKDKAKNGDNFASQFVSVFIPYENIEEVKEIFPEYMELYYQQFNEEDKVYFYHCPRITDENLCSIYEFRPQICRDFPDNPLSLLPSTCGYKEWKDEVHVASLILHALIEILEFNVKKIESVIE